MSTARKPVTPPEPRHVNRPLAQSNGEPIKNPLTREVMERIRQVIHDSAGEITVGSVAEEIGAGSSKLTEWLSGFRSSPNSERFAQLCRWLYAQDPSFLPNVFGTKLKTIKPVGALHSTKIPDSVVRAIRASNLGVVELAKKHHLHRDNVRLIRNRELRADVQ